jgi:L-lactate dehydrogenase
VLVDVNRERAEGEAMDLNHAVPLSHSIRIRVGDYSDCAGADIVAIAAGVSQKPGESRLQLLQRNAAIFESIVPQITAHNQDGILLVATNPVDVLSYVAWKVSGFPAERVIGSGTVLDTARFRYLLGQHLGVDPRSVHAYIAGEHGDSEVPIWSLANVGGMRLGDFCAQHGCELSGETKDSIFAQTRDAAYEIIHRKGATYYAVAVGLLRITEAILRDQHTVLSVSSLVPGFYGIQDVYLSLPAIVARSGVQDVLHLTLSPHETAELRHSASILRGLLDKLDLD